MAKVWVLEMLRYGDRESHSYVAGVFSSESEAREEGQRHHEYRGGKYDPSVEGFEIDGDKSTVEKVQLQVCGRCKGRFADLAPGSHLCRD